MAKMSERRKKARKKKTKDRRELSRPQSSMTKLENLTHEIIRKHKKQ
jgi:hypothetical protein